MLSLEFWGAKKEAPEARKQEFVLSLEFFAVKLALWGSPGGRKGHFHHVFQQVLQKAPNRGNRRKSQLPAVSAETALCRVFDKITHESGPPRGGPIGGDPSGGDSHSLSTPSFDGVGGSFEPFANDLLDDAKVNLRLKT